MDLLILYGFPPMNNNKMLQRLGKLLAVKLVLLLFPFLLHFLYTDAIWIGYAVLSVWVAVQLIILELIIKEFCSTPWNEDKLLDFLLSALCAFIIFIVSASIAIDCIPENYTSFIHINESLLSKPQCETIVNVAEFHSTNRSWQTSRHKFYPTTDIAVNTIKQNVTLIGHDIEPLVIDFATWINQIIDAEVLPTLVRQYNVPFIDSLSVKDLFIVKYDADTYNAQRHLDMHRDSSQLSFNIALSPLIELEPTDNSSSIIAYFHISNDSSSSSDNNNGYAGGGTQFSILQEQHTVISLPRGGILTHPSGLYHSGNAITKGKRYVLVGFVNVPFYKRHDRYYYYQLVSKWSSIIWRRFGLLSKCVVVIKETVISAGKCNNNINDNCSIDDNSNSGSSDDNIATNNNKVCINIDNCLNENNQYTNICSCKNNNSNNSRINKQDRTGTRSTTFMHIYY